MLKICLVFWESEPQYAYKLYDYKKKHVVINGWLQILQIQTLDKARDIMKDLMSRY